MQVLLAMAGLCGVAAAVEYERSEAFVGQDFFKTFRWDFHTGDDPTHGTVDYVSYSAAANGGLINASSDRVYMGADHRTAIDPRLAQGAGSRGRPSVRIMSRQGYNSGLFVLTLDHMPTGCGVWPAFWMYGEDPQHPWPTWGEFDIIEGVHHASRTMTTLHTTPGCNQKNIKAGEHFLGQWVKDKGQDADNCDVNAEGQWANQGCSQQGPEGSFGPAFNANGGGTFAAEWDPEAGHFRTWFWPKSQGVPADISAQKPNPDAWGKPYSYFSISDEDCNKDHFRNMHLVFDITFCGDLGSPTFQAGCPAVAQSMTCEEFVERHPEEFKEAYWSIRGLDVYQSSHGGPQMHVEESGGQAWQDADGGFGGSVGQVVNANANTMPSPAAEAPAAAPVAAGQDEGLVPLTDAVLPLQGESISSGYATPYGQVHFAETAPAAQDASNPAAAPLAWPTASTGSDQGFTAYVQTTTVAPAGFLASPFLSSIAMKFRGDVHVRIARLPAKGPIVWTAFVLAAVVSSMILAGAWRRGALWWSLRRPSADETGAGRVKSSGYKELLGVSAPEPMAEIALAEP